MKAGFLKEPIGKTMAVAVLTFVVAFTAGCKRQAPVPTDQQIATNIQAKIHGESALAGQDIQVSVAKGVATLSGTVADPASRALAGNDSGTVPGVKTVVNNLTVQSGESAATQPETASAAAPEPRREEPPPPARHRDRVRPERSNPAPAPPAQPPAQQEQAAAPAPPPAPVKPVVKQVTLPAGTMIPVRISEMLSSKDSQPNDVFHASLATDLGTEGVIALRQGTPILGRVIDARNAAHFKGRSLLSLELTQIRPNGQKIALTTAPFDKEGAARGKNTLEKTGGGALLGAIIGGIAGGGKGAAIGTLAGGAAGTGVNAATRGQQVEIPSETLINFRLSAPVTLTVGPGTQGQGANPMPDPQLQNR